MDGTQLEAWASLKASEDVPNGRLARVLLIVPFALVSLAAGERDAALIEAAKTQDHQMVAALVEGGATAYNLM